jgi:hypothetical protein
MKFFNFFLLSWVFFALLDTNPDPDSESGSTDPIESGSGYGSGSATLKIRQLKFQVPAERNQVKVRRTHQRLEAMPK